MPKRFFSIIFLLMLSLPAWADEWIVNRVRGDAQFLSGGQWAELTRGLAIVDGLEMLIGQAALAFDIFFDADAPREHDEELRALLTA